MTNSARFAPIDTRTELPISAGMQLSSSAHIERSELREACPQPTAAGTSQDACALRGQQVGASHRLGSVEWVAGQDLEVDLHAGGPFGQ
jgi:hypothetical protein